MLFFSSRRRHMICALVTGVQTWALPSLCAVATYDGGAERRLSLEAAQGRAARATPPCRGGLAARRNATPRRPLPPSAFRRTAAARGASTDPGLSARRPSARRTAAQYRCQASRPGPTLAAPTTGEAQPDHDP